MKKKALIIAIFTVLLFAAGTINSYAAQTVSETTSGVFSLLSFIIPIIIVTAVIIIIISVIRRAGRLASKWTASTLSSLISSLISKETARQNNEQPVESFSTNTLPKDNTVKIVSAVRLIDSGFMGEAFLSWANNVFITLQRAWTARNWSSVITLEKEELFELHRQQLDKYIKSGRVNVRDRISIGTSYLHKYERNRSYEYLTVYMEADMTDYIIKADTGVILSGNPNTLTHNKYLLTFMRKRGFLSNDECNRINTRHCPNCGAVLSMSSSSKCDYCGGIITKEDFNWVLSNMELFTNNTVVDNRGVIISD
ncbi:MAG: zinc-ribbon domain-containing transport protein [Acutalibacteraceae bacterium]